MPKRPAPIVAAVLLSLLPLLGCKPAPSPEARAVAPDPLGGLDCPAGPVPTVLDVTGWEAAERAQLDKLRRQGVVAVRLETRGCETTLELVPQCVGPKNRYVYVPTNGADTKIARDTRALVRELPLGASRLAKALAPRRAIRVDAKVVGTVGLPAGSTVTEYDLVGPECKRATHVVEAVHVGGFALATLDAPSVEARNLFTSTAPIEGATREGAAPICARSEAERIELPGCSAPIRVTLRPIGAPVPEPAPKSLPPPERPCAEDADAGCEADDAADAGEPRVFDQYTVERTVREKQGTVKRKCWSVAPDTLRRASVTVTATIDPNGRVVEAQSQLLDSEGSADVAASVARCLAAEVQTWRFPEPDKAQKFTVPFRFIRQ